MTNGRKIPVEEVRDIKKFLKRPRGEVILEEYMPPKLTQLINAWHDEVESNPDFQKKTLVLKNKERSDYFENIIKPLAKDEGEAKILSQYFKPNFFESFLRHAIEAAVPFVEPPPTIRPAHPAGAMAGTVLGEFGPLLVTGAAVQKGAGIAAKTFGKRALKAAAKGLPPPRFPLLAQPGPVGRGMRSALTFGGADVPAVVTGKREPAEMGRSALLGAFGGAPALPWAKGLAAGLYQTATSRPEEAWITGTPIVDVGVPTALIFYGMGKFERAMAKARAKRLSPQEELTKFMEGTPEGRRDLGKVSARPLMGQEGFVEAVIKEEQNIVAENLNYVNKTSRVLGRQLADAKAPELIQELERTTAAVRDAFQKGDEALIVQAMGLFDDVVAASTEHVGKVPPAEWFGGDSQWKISSSGARAVAGVGKKVGPQTKKALEWVFDKSIPVDEARVEGLKDVPGPKGYSELDVYLAEQALTKKGPFSSARLVEIGLSEPELPSFIRTLREARMLRSWSVKGDYLQKRRARIIRGDSIGTAVAEKLEEIERMPISAAAKKNLRARVNREVALHETRRVAVKEKRVKAVKKAQEAREEAKPPEEQGKAVAEEAAAEEKELELIEEEPEVYEPPKKPGSLPPGVDYELLDNLTKKNIRQIGASRGATARPEASDPLYIAELLDKKGYEGAWNSTTGEIRVKVEADTWKPVSLEQLENMAEAGDRIMGQTVITTAAGRKVNIVKGPKGLTVQEKTLHAPSKKLQIRDLTFDELRDIFLANQGFVLEYKTADGGVIFRRIVDGTRGKLSLEELEALIKEPMYLEDLTPEVEVTADPTSFDSSGFAHKPPTDPPRTFWGKVRQHFREQPPLAIITPPKSLFAQYQKALQIPTYDIYSSLKLSTDQVRKWMKQIYPKLASLQRILKGANEEGITQYLRHKDYRARLSVAREYGLTRKDVQAAQVAETIAKETFGSDYMNFLADYIPTAYESGEIADALRPWVGSGLNPANTRIYDLLNNAVHARMRMFVRPQMEAFTELKKALLENPSISSQTAGKIRRDITLHQSAMMMQLNGDHQFASDFFKILGAHVGRDLTGSFSDALTSWFLLCTYSSVMPFRVGLVMRNLTQTLTTTSLYTGMEGWMRGVKRLASKEGLELCRELGYRLYWCAYGTLTTWQR